MTSAVRLAAAVRKVMYRVTLKTAYSTCRGYRR
jgi:hypothetical protein